MSTKTPIQRGGDGAVLRPGRGEGTGNSAGAPALRTSSFQLMSNTRVAATPGWEGLGLGPRCGVSHVCNGTKQKCSL